jgi:hypothetical protein
MRSIAVLALLSSVSFGQGFTPVPRARLAPTTASWGAGHGTAMAAQMDRLLVGAPGDNSPPVSSAGQAYVWRRQAHVWSIEQTLAAPSPGVADRFGAAVAIDGSTIAVGSPGKGPNFSDEDLGCVYVFERGSSGWSVSQQIDPPIVPNPQIGAFGSALVLAGDTLFVGAPLDHEFSSGGSGTSPGGVYVYQRPPGGAFAFASLLRASDFEHDAHFGGALSKSGSALAVGAWKDSLVGAIYVFRESGGNWIEEEKLVASDAAVAAYLGTSVSIDGDRIASGAPELFDQGVPPGAGAVYVFDRSAQGWSETVKLRASAPVVGALFGRSVALGGRRLAVGARDESTFGGTWGRAYVFDLLGGVWSESSRLEPSEANSSINRFGESCQWIGADLAVGAPGENLWPYAGGAVYTFGFLAPAGTLACDGQTGCPCGNAGAAGAGCANSTGEGTVLGVVGSTSLAEDDL